MIIIDTGELSKEFLNQWQLQHDNNELRFEPSNWVITDYGENCYDITKRYTLEFINLQDECAWAYSARSLDVVIIEAKRIGLEGVRGVV